MADELSDKAEDLLDKVEEMTAEQRAALKEKLEQLDKKDEE